MTQIMIMLSPQDHRQHSVLHHPATDQTRGHLQLDQIIARVLLTALMVTDPLVPMVMVTVTLTVDTVHLDIDRLHLPPTIKTLTTDPVDLDRQVAATTDQVVHPMAMIIDHHHLPLQFIRRVAHRHQNHPTDHRAAVPADTDPVAVIISDQTVNRAEAVVP